MRLILACTTILPFCMQAPACAAEIETGTDVRLRWDNTVTATFGFRVNGADAGLLADPNGDDGDRAFAPGAISQRLDVLSQLDLSLGDAGLFVSVDGWYDAAYHGRTANTSPATFNPISVPANRFPAATRTLDGGDGELLAAYLHDKFSVDGIPVTLRVGRQTLLWGESLFFPANGIAAGQAPFDAAKALADPLAQAKELYLPVAQAVAIVQLSTKLGVQAYVQGEWRRDRLPGVASYFSTADYLDAGGERLFAGAGYYTRGNDRTPSGTPQFGAAVRYTTDIVDIGLYALRFDAKEPEIFVTPYPVGVSPLLGRYGLAYGHGIDLYGASISGYLGNSTIAGEISWRQHMPLVSAFQQPTASGAATFASPAYPNTRYATGDTLHAQVSLVTTLPPSRLWPGANLQAEFAANDRISVTEAPDMLAPGRDRFATAFRVVYAAQFFEILPHVEMSVPVGIGYNLTGNSSVFSGQNAHAGDVEIGADITWRVVWQAALNFTHFVGSAEHQAYTDRDFATLTVSRSF